MYIPAYFAQTDRQKLHDFIERHSFGLLVSSLGSVPFASHLPFLLERQAGSRGMIIGHMARANPQWQELEGQRVLVVFSGPHAYISPSWYEAENVVPTWNYAAVHAYGTARLVQDRDALLKIVTDSVAWYEANLPQPWSLNADPTFVDRLLSQIVGFRIEIETLEGKFKLNQNHPAERREKVVQRLQEAGGEDRLNIAQLMQQIATKGPDL